MNHVHVHHDIKIPYQCFQESHQHQIIITLVNLAKDLTILQKKLQAGAQCSNSSHLLTAQRHMIPHTFTC
jgi:hypothetical protein